MYTIRLKNNKIKICLIFCINPFISGIFKEHVYFISYLYFMSIEHTILNISNIRFDLITQILDTLHTRYGVFADLQII